MTDNSLSHDKALSTSTLHDLTDLWHKLKILLVKPHFYFIFYTSAIWSFLVAITESDLSLTAFSRIKSYWVIHPKWTLLLVIECYNIFTIYILKYISTPLHSREEPGAFQSRIIIHLFQLCSNFQKWKTIEPLNHHNEHCCL